MALEALATDVLKSLGEKLFSSAVKEILFAADTESHIKSLANTKVMIEAVLLDADAQEGHSHVQRLELEKLSRLLEKIDDLLDEKATRFELKKLAAASGFKDQIPLPSTKESLQQLLLKKIERRKYLLVLDDIWDDDSSLSKKWEELRNVLVCGGVGSKVLITTRDERVARIVDRAETYKVGDLGKEDSWVLFQRAAVPHEGQVEQVLKDIGQEILERCPKVPLVIRAIGGLLREQEPTKDKWQAFRDGPLQDLSSAVPDVMESLKLSYNQLDPRLKLCFAYCSLFPGGWEFNKDELICLWIALGYVEAQYRTQNLEEAGEEYVLSLMNRGFFQNAKKDEFGSITGFRMHDMMYDLAVLVTGSKYKMLDTDSVETGHELDERVCHVSFSKAVENLLPLLRKNKENLQSLLLPRPRSNNPIELQLNGLSRFRHLRVLRLRDLHLKDVPKSTGKLIHLRHLDLSENSLIRKLPNSITQLVNLLSVDLYNCYRLVELPRDIRKLVKLRHLNLDGCVELSHMPLGLGNLTNLQTLGRFAVRTGNRTNNEGVGGLDELNCLSNLKGELALVLDSDFEHEGANEKLMANLKEKKKLAYLSIHMFFKQSKEKSEIVLEGLQPHPNLRRLWVKRYDGERLPSWMMSWGQLPYNSLPNLVRIQLSDFNNCRYLCSFGRLPHLKFLKLSYMRQLEYVENTSTATGSPHPTPTNPPATVSAPNPLFPSLEQLELWSMPKLKGWRKIMGKSSGKEESQILQNCGYYSAFPGLKILVFIGVGLEVVPEEFRDLSALGLLLLDDCEELKELLGWIDTLTSLKELSIANSPKLKSLPKPMANLTKLEKLYIIQCPTLEERCKEPTGEDWPLIQHVPRVHMGDSLARIL
ncbi:hypothetical protein Cgig2_007947 [Carnegiea gigantea]|uniref:NB-ARC domain-containing protein n=1 Tax=Carnegiea gigantea TaxID=171969 RepID=A0A9Q1QHM0_9CARY|nr:hypothetical protein Cgig2_007947 [Carnegiea gigantea]